MKTLQDCEIAEELIRQLHNTQKSVVIITAFCKVEAFKVIEENLSKEIQEKIVIVRFRKDDIVSHVTDLEMYDFCKSNGWSLYINLDLHAKMFVSDKKKSILGSANVTQKGLGLIDRCNEELAVSYELEREDFQKVERLIADSVYMSNEIYLCMLNQLRKPENKGHDFENWDNHLLELCTSNLSTIFVSELPSCPYDDKININRCGFLNQSLEGSLEENFRRSKSFRWLINALQQKDTKEMYYGELTAYLHTNIINEPKPYRKDVKILLSNLLTWVEALESDRVGQDTPNHSTRIFLK